MKAARMFAIRDVRVVDSPTPEPEVDEILLRVKACAICASDLHLYEEGHSSGAYPSGPIILGHEFSGEIAKLGAEVSGWQIGDRVACEPSWHCKQCDMCRRGLTNLCRNVIFPSYPDRDGAMAEYIAIPAFSLVKLPDNMNFIAGALAEPLGVALHAVRLSGFQPGMNVAVLGAGAIGLAIMLMCQALGAKEILVAEPRAARQAQPAALGAKVAPKAEALHAYFETGAEPHIVFEAAGGERSFAEALELAGPAGTVMAVGIPSLDQQEFQASIPRRKELRVQFCRRSRETLPDCLAMMSNGRLDATAFPVREYSLDDASEALEASCRRDSDIVRAVIVP